MPLEDASDDFTVFISYAHTDNESPEPSKRWLNRLLEQLQPLVLQDKVKAWSDTQIEAGQLWDQSIKIQLQSAKAAVLLLSPAFLASKYIRNSELPVLLMNAMNEGRTVIPIILRPCLFTETKFKYPHPVKGPGELSLSVFQSANPPSKSLNSMQEHEQDQVLVSVAQRILKLAQQAPLGGLMQGHVLRESPISPNSPKDYQVRKILVLAANPINTLPLRLDEEVREISEGLRRARQRDRFLIEQKSAVRVRDLRRAMLDSEPQIVHFSGHGETAGLVVEDDNGNTQVVSKEALSSLFKLFKDTVECVILNACYSAPQAEAISLHIPYVIGMSKEITDTAAIEFAVGFYDSLGAGRSIESAFEFGLNAMMLQGIAEHLIPILHKRDTKGLGLTSAKPLETPPQQPRARLFQTHGGLRFKAPSYIERECDTLLKEELKHSRPIAIVGDYQIGKTSLLNQVKSYLPKEWEHCFLDLQGTRTDDLGRLTSKFFKVVSSVIGETDSWDDLVGRVQNHPAAILLDEFGSLGGDPHVAALFIEKLVWLSDSQDVRIVVCLPDSISEFVRQQKVRNPKYWASWRSILVEPFNEQEVSRILKLLPERASRVALAHLEEISARTNGHPQRLQQLCKRLAEGADRNETVDGLLSIINYHGEE
jgi:hypothetical protein